MYHIPSNLGRCFKAVDPVSEGKAKFIPIDEQPNHEIVHMLRLGEAQCTTHESLDPGPQIHVFTLDFLRVLLPHLVLLGLDMPLVGAPSVGVILRDTKGLQQRLQPQEDRVLPPSKHLR